MTKILLCDDSMLIRLQIKNFLLEKFQDIQILEAKNGAEALEVIAKEDPSLVIMDIVMPEMDGLECVRNIKTNKSRCKIVILSSVGNKETLKEALKAGADNFMQKPWSEELLISTIKQYL